RADAVIREIDRPLDVRDLPDGQLAVGHRVLSDVGCWPFALNRQRLDREHLLAPAERVDSVVDDLMLGRGPSAPGGHGEQGEDTQQLFHAGSLLQLAACGWLLAARFLRWVLAACFLLLASCGSLLAARCLLLASCGSLLASPPLAAAGLVAAGLSLLAAGGRK